MEKFTKYPCLEGQSFWVRLCLSIIICFVALGPVSLFGKQSVKVKGRYFLFCDDIKYIYGSGKISIKGKESVLSGNVLYMDVNTLSGVLYGDVNIGGHERRWDAVFFKLFPLKILHVSYGETLHMEGDQTLKKEFGNFLKKAPKILKDASLYYELREFRIDDNKKIKAKFVIPYMVGLPTVPLKRFTVNRGKWADKTMLSFNNINYSGLDGLSLSFFFRLREKLISGDYDLKLYERRLFKLDDPKRGFLFSGKSSFFGNKKNKNLLGFTTLFNSGEKSFNLRFHHKLDSKRFRYAITQTVSGRKKLPTFFEFRWDVWLKGIKHVEPAFNVTHNLKKSYSYRVSLPVNLGKRLNLGMDWQRKIIKDQYQSDTSDFSTSLSYDASLLSLNSSFNFSRNMLEASVRKNYTVNLKLKPLRFLEKNISIDIGSFYMFSSLPFGESTRKRISPGLTAAVRSIGARLAWGVRLVPGFTLNHLWDNLEENFTDFNYTLSLQRDIGNFTASVDYALASRYRSESMWIEGNNRQNLHLNFQLLDRFKNNYSFLLRFYHNTDLALENISFNGKLNLPYDLSFSSFLLYYHKEKKFQTMEIFIQKTFKKKIKIQGGYSLALKRFFIKFLTQ